HLGFDLNTLPPANPQRAAVALVELRAGLERNGRHPGAKGSWLGSPMDGRVWVTCSGASAPHEQALGAGLDADGACWQIARRMALCGYDSAAVRVEKIGFAALEYEIALDRSLYRPTVADALAHPYFFPGRKGHGSGETWPLAAALD